MPPSAADAAIAAFHQHHGRQGMDIGGVAITPDMLSQIDLSDHSTITSWIWGVSLASIVLICLVVPLRLAVRHFMLRQFFADDILIIIAMICTILVGALTLAATKFGFGEHVWNLPLDDIIFDIERCIQLMFVANVAYACAIAFTKFSIMVSYLRIFPHKSLRYCMFAIGALTAGLLVTSIPATILQCRPVAAAWDFAIQNAVCYTFVDFLYTSTAINIFTDLALCIIPLPFFWKLQLPRKQRLLVSGLFVIGGFACVASIIRISSLRHLVNGIDITHNLVISVLWTIAECTIGIVCVSVPTLRPLLAKMAPKFFSAGRTVGSTNLSGKAKTFGLSGGLSGSSRSHGIMVESRVDQDQADPAEHLDTDAEGWAFSRLDSARADRVWDGSAESGFVMASMTAEPKRPGKVSVSTSPRSDRQYDDFPGTKWDK